MPQREDENCPQLRTIDLGRDSIRIQVHILWIKKDFFYLLLSTALSDDRLQM